MRNQKGVTLIALVVTIIVLIIIAGIAIATLLGDNGVITRSKEAKRSQIRGEVRDDITLAIASAKMLAEQKSVESSTFSASYDINNDGKTVNQTTYDGVILDELRGELNGWTVSGTTKTPKTGDYTVAIDGTASDDSVTLKITYHSAKYDDAMNEDNKAITVTVTVALNVFTINDATWTYDATFAG